MSLTSPYATFAQYKALTGLTVDTDQVVIEQLLEIVSRLVERECGRNFNQTAAGVVRYYDGTGDAELYVDDFTTLTAIAVDTSGLGVHDTVIPVDAAYLLMRGMDPHGYQAAEYGFPYTSLILNPGGVLGAWPRIRRAVRLTGTHGWASVPTPILDAVVAVTKQLKDLNKSGLTMELGAVDSTIKVLPGAFSLIQSLKTQYSRSYPQIGAF